MITGERNPRGMRQNGFISSNDAPTRADICAVTPGFTSPPWVSCVFVWKKGCPTWSPSVKMCYSSQADGKTSLWEHLLAPAIAAKPKTWQLSEQPYHQVYGGCKQLDRWNHLSRPTKPCHDEPTDLQPKGCSSWSATRMRSGKPWLENYLHSSH